MIDRLPRPRPAPDRSDPDAGQLPAVEVAPEARAAVGGNRQRRLVLDALATSGFVSAQELHARLRLGAAGTIGLNTVYVTLRLLRDAGYADTVHDSRAGKLFSLRASPGHDHYLRCDFAAARRPSPARRSRNSSAPSPEPPAGTRSHTPWSSPADARSVARTSRPDQLPTAVFGPGAHDPGPGRWVADRADARAAVAAVSSPPRGVAVSSRAAGVIRPGAAR